MTSTELRGIVVFMADQVRADHLGFGGNRDVRTPNLDALAARSLVADRCHAANPTCMPNRATIFTGRWPSVHGTRTNGIALDWRANTVARQLRNAGWNTASVGKVHLQNMGFPWEEYEVDDIRRSQPLQLDPTVLDAVDKGLPAGWDRWETFDLHATGARELPRDFYGFDHVDLVVGHADAPSGHYRSWVDARGLDLDAVAGYDNASSRYDGWDEVWQSNVPAALHPTAYVRERTIERLEQFASEERPFLVVCSFPDPHHPFSPPAPYASMYDPAEVAIPSTFDDEHRRSPRHIRQMIAERGKPRPFAACWAPTEDQLRHALAAQYGSVTFIDDAIGEVMSTLGRLGLDDSVAVVFTSDHGDMFGDHGLLLKHTVHYPALTRVPLLIRAPQIAAGRFDGLASSADITPTLLDIAGVTHYRGIQGRSLVDGVRAPRDQVVVEEEHLFGIDGLSAPINIRTLITDRARMTIYAGEGHGELYDHEADPDELDNLYGRGTPLQHELTSRLALELIDLADRGTAPWASA